MQHLTTRTIALRGTSKETAAQSDLAPLAALQYAQAWPRSSKTPQGHRAGLRRPANS